MIYPMQVAVDVWGGTQRYLLTDPYTVPCSGQIEVTQCAIGSNIMNVFFVYIICYSIGLIDFFIFFIFWCWIFREFLLLQSSCYTEPILPFGDEIIIYLRDLWAGNTMRNVVLNATF